MLIISLKRVIDTKKIQNLNLNNFQLKSPQLVENNNNNNKATCQGLLDP